MRVEVSVIVPVFNTGKVAKKLVGKILKSKVSGLEVILVDDGSTDGSFEIPESLNDERVRVFQKENGGPSAARNYGIDEARGEYLMFVDSDDSLDEEFIAKMLSRAKEEGVALAVSGVKYRKLWQNTEEDVYLDEFGYKEGENNVGLVLRSLLHDGRMYPAFNKIFKADVVKGKQLRFDERMNFGEDTKFVLDYLKLADGKVSFVLEPLYIYNAGTPTSTAKKMEKSWRNWRKCYQNLEKWVGKKKSLEQKKLLMLIYLKWRVSWLKAKI